MSVSPVILMTLIGLVGIFLASTVVLTLVLLWIRKLYSVSLASRDTLIQTQQGYLERLQNLQISGDLPTFLSLQSTNPSVLYPFSEPVGMSDLEEAQRYYSAQGIGEEVYLGVNDDGFTGG
jgi:hypothetical protein